MTCARQTYSESECARPVLRCAKHRHFDCSTWIGGHTALSSITRQYFHSGELGVGISFIPKFFNKTKKTCGTTLTSRKKRVLNSNRLPRLLIWICCHILPLLCLSTRSDLNFKPNREILNLDNEKA